MMQERGTNENDSTSAHEYQEKCKRLDMICRTTEICTFLLFFGQEYIIRAGRLSVMWQLGKFYEPAFSEETGDLVYFYREYYEVSQPSDEVLEEGGCVTLISDSRNFTEAPSDTCSLIFIDLNLRLVSTWWQRFSLVLGFLIFFALQVGVFYYEDKFKQFLQKKRTHCNVFCKGFITFVSFPMVYILFLLVASQQSLVLMPTAVVTPRPYCLEFDVPEPFLSIEQFVCFHLWSAAGIPIGIPLLFVCFIGAQFIFVCFDSIGSCCDGCDLNKCLLGCGGCALILAFVIPVILSVGSWLVLGLGFGPWIHFTTYLSQSVFLVNEIMAPSVTVMNDALNEFFM